MLAKASTIYEQLVPGGLCENRTTGLCKKNVDQFRVSFNRKIADISGEDSWFFPAKILNRFGEPSKNSSVSLKFANLRMMFQSDFV